MPHYTRCWIGLILVLLGLLITNLLQGSVALPHTAIWEALWQGPTSTTQTALIVWQLRLPALMVALLAGAALAGAGLLTQTLFANPLADPAILGINTGAALGTALAMLWLGGNTVLGDVSIVGVTGLLLAAFVGAMCVIAILLYCSLHLHNNLVLLIVGLMLSYVLGSGISLLNYFASATGVQAFFVWGMGHFGGVSLARLPYFVVLVVVTLGVVLTRIRHLDLLLLGDLHARTLGLDIRRERTLLLLLIGILSATTTAFCGPIAFIGLAAPHITYFLIGTALHRVLLPATLCMGSIIALSCQYLSNLSLGGGYLPINVLTPLVGVPVMLYLLLGRRRN